MSSRIEKGSRRFQPTLVGTARRRPGQPDLPKGPRSTGATGGAMSPPPPSGSSRSHLTPSASPHPSSSSSGAIRSYASAAPSSSRIQVAGQLPLVNFRPPTVKPASIVPGSGATAAARIPPSSGSGFQRRPATTPQPPASGRVPETSEAVHYEDGADLVTSEGPSLVVPSAAFTPGISSSRPRPPAAALRRSQIPPSPTVKEKPVSASIAANAVQPLPLSGQDGDPQHLSTPMSNEDSDNSSNYHPSNIQFQPPLGRLPTSAEVTSTVPSVLRKGKEKAGAPAPPRLKRHRTGAGQDAPVPTAAFYLFSQDRTTSLLEEHPDATPAELSQLLHSAWDEASNQEKAYWQNQAHESRGVSGTTRDSTSVSTMEQTLTQDRDGLTVNDTDASENSMNSRSSNKRRKRGVAGPIGERRKAGKGQPKKPATAYILYSQEIRRSQRGEDSQDDPRKESFAELSKRIGDQWRNLPLEQKQPYLRQAEELKAQYHAAVESWKGQQPDQAADETDANPSESEGELNPRKSQSKAVQRSISDDEREYEALIAEHGKELDDLRIDPKTTSMADLAAAELKSGRASSRLFELGRVRIKQLGDAAALRKAEREQLKKRIQQTEENLRKQQAGEQVNLPRYDPKKDPLRRRGRPELLEAEQQPQPQLRGVQPLTGSAQVVVAQKSLRSGEGDEEGEEEEEVEALSGADREHSGYVLPTLDDDEEEAQEQQRIRDLLSGDPGDGLTQLSRSAADADNESDAGSDAGSVRSAASAGTYASLRETAHVPQVRVVDGQIVLDETSLTVNRNQEQSFEESEMIDEEIGHKFVNSSTGIKREKSIRWTPAETDKFFKAVSMWGSDFEMISRMFPNRSRKQVKNKWTREEKASPARLDLAFARKLPVDLENYAILANVDLSGPAPRVDDGIPGEETAMLINKGEEEDEDAQGGDGQAERRNIAKVSSTPDPSRNRRGSSAGAGEGSRSLRASSVASARSGAGGDASSSRQHPKSRQQIEREKREAREKARRADSLLEGRDKRSSSRGTSRGAAGAAEQSDPAYLGRPEEEEVVPLPEGY